VLLCFFIGVAGATGIAYKLGRIGSSAAVASSLDDAVSRATDAFRNRRFDAPSGDNVKDITDDALRRFPNDSRLLEIRSHAANDLVTVAIEQRQAGAALDALRALKLALELHPEERSAKTLMDQYETELRATTTLAPLDPPVKERVPGSAASISASMRLTPQGNSSMRAVLDATPDRPRLGQPVQFVVKVSTATGGAARGPFVESHFEISGPGIREHAKLIAVSEQPGVFEGAFTFFAQGRYEVVFLSRVDGARLSVARAVVVGDAPPVAPLPVPSSVPAPPPIPSMVLPAPSGKWL
jgi:hypothetical protein